MYKRLFSKIATVCVFCDTIREYFVIFLTRTCERFLNQRGFFFDCSRFCMKTEDWTSHKFRYHTLHTKQWYFHSDYRTNFSCDLDFSIFFEVKDVNSCQYCRTQLITRYFDTFTDSFFDFLGHNHSIDMHWGWWCHSDQWYDFTVGWFRISQREHVWGFVSTKDIYEHFDTNQDWDSEPDMDD